MSQDHRLQQQRFELKYLIKEELTRPIRDFVSAYLELDDFSAGKPGNAYDIYSTYLDSSVLHTHQATLNGEKNRFKLRFRHYDTAPDAPVFCEIKRRVDDCILKSRCAIRAEAVPLVLAGITPGDDLLLGREAHHQMALHRFIELMLRLNARPRLRNHYKREAWVSPHDNSVRVTMDRNVCVQPCGEDRALGPLNHPTHIYREFVILELKFTGRYPGWFNALVERFNLMRGAAMKYSGGVACLGEQVFKQTCIPKETLEMLPLNH
jgi:hypothetical protein